MLFLPEVPGIKGDAMVSLTERFTDALVYATNLHATQTRKGKRTPYIAHLLSVSALVLEDGGSEYEAIAALLHDALEDQPDKTSPEEIRHNFGSTVLDLVLACTDTPPNYKGGRKAPWKIRKERYLAHLRDNGSPEVLRLAMADKLHNLRDLVSDYRLQGEAVWNRFNTGKEEQLWYYRSLLDIFDEKLPSRKVFNDFQQAFHELETLASLGK
jgi:(p)ppGpp synthase/HD superfamily hydrolase